MPEPIGETQPDTAISPVSGIRNTWIVRPVGFVGHLRSTASRQRFPSYIRRDRLTGQPFAVLFVKVRVEKGNQDGRRDECR
jgi:hypothetical protein